MVATLSELELRQLRSDVLDCSCVHTECTLVKRLLESMESTDELHRRIRYLERCLRMAMHDLEREDEDFDPDEHHWLPFSAAIEPMLVRHSGEPSLHTFRA